MWETLDTCVPSKDIHYVNFNELIKENLRHVQGLVIPFNKKVGNYTKKRLMEKQIRRCDWL